MYERAIESLRREVSFAEFSSIATHLILSKFKYSYRRIPEEDRTKVIGYLEDALKGKFTDAHAVPYMRLIRQRDSSKTIRDLQALANAWRVTNPRSRLARYYYFVLSLAFWLRTGNPESLQAATELQEEGCAPARGYLVYGW